MSLMSLRSLIFMMEIEMRAIRMSMMIVALLMRAWMVQMAAAGAIARAETRGRGREKGTGKVGVGMAVGIGIG